MRIEYKHNTYETVLEFVNAVRADYELPELEKLSKGTPGDAEADCIVKSITEGAPSYIQSVAFPDTVGVFSWETNVTTVYDTPDCVRDFMHEFDTRHIPELILER